MKRFLVVLGARPSVVKLAPVVGALKALGASVHVCSTGQHKELFEDTAGPLRFQVDSNLGVMKPRQSLSEILARCVSGVGDTIEKVGPDVVVTVGDTTSGLAAAMAAFNSGVPLAHVEAGLRTYVDDDPFPEEVNRRMIDMVSRYCFAPTELAAANLCSEGIPPERIFITGNPVVDSMTRLVLPERDEPVFGKPFALVTAHRRENLGQGILNICAAIRTLAADFPAVRFVWPLHANPAVADVVRRELGNVPGVVLEKPMGYLDFMWHLKYCRIVLTDSGGVQEEAATVGRKCVVMRKTTERPEGVDCGSAVLVGTDTEKIVDGFRQMMKTDVTPRNIYGDGKAGRRIADILVNGKSDIPMFIGESSYD